MKTVVERWYALAKAQDLAALDAILAEDAVFYSPAVHSAQVGKALVFKYLKAAFAVLNNDSFTYLDEWQNETSAVLHFETVLDGIHVNGIDMIRWNDQGQITEFKVMIRPLKGINTVIPLMRDQLMA